MNFRQGNSAALRRQARLPTRHQRDILNFYIATSRDGDPLDLGWVYDAKPMIRRGPEGVFDKDMIVPALSDCDLEGPPLDLLRCQQ